MLSKTLLNAALALASLLTTSTANPLPARPTSLSNPELRTVLTQPIGSWLENIAVRPDGTLLATRLDVPELYLIDPATGSSSLLSTFPGVNGALGIAEYAPDVFAVAVGDFNLSSFASTPGTYSIQTIDLSKGTENVQPKLLAELKDAANLNGLTFRAPSTLYAADSFGFKVWGVDTKTGEVSVAVDTHPLLQKCPNSANTSVDYALSLDTDLALKLCKHTVPFGINGLKWDERAQQLFFTNSDLAIVGRIPTACGQCFGPPEQLAAASAVGLGLYDDFALGPYDANLFLQTNPFNTVNFLSRDGKTQDILAGAVNSTELQGATASAFGRKAEDINTLYVVTNGGLAGGNTTTQIPAHVIALDFSN